MSGNNNTPKPSPTSEVRQRTLWQSYAALPAQTRLRLSLGMFAFAAVGLYVSDHLEAVYPSSDAPNQQEQQQRPGSDSNDTRSK